MNANIKKLYAFSAFEGLILFYSFDKVFLQLKGLTITQVVLVEIIYFVTILLLEVPSGALSDRWSRKYVLSLSGLLFGLYILAFAVGESFSVFALGALAAGFGAAFLSGTDTSLLYDSLKELGEEDKYEKYLGRKRAIGSIVFIGASALGGLIGQKYGLELAIWLSLPSMIIATLIALTVREPQFHRSTGEVKYWEHVQQTFSFLTKQPRFLHLAGLITAVMAPALLIEEYQQVYLVFIGLGALGLGIVGSFTGLFDALFSTIAFRFKKFGHDVLYGLILVLFSGGFLSAWLFQNWIGAVLLFVGSFTLIFVIEILAMADFNRQLPSSMRATSESFFSVATQIVHIPLALAFAFISQRYSVAAGFGMVGALLSAYTIFYWLSTVRIMSAKGAVE